MRTQGYLAFAAGILLTVISCMQVRDAQQAGIRATFARDTEKIASDANVRLQIYVDMLLSVKGTFAVNENISRRQFALFVRELKLSQRYPGFLAIQFVRVVPADGLARFTAAVRADTSLDPAGNPLFEVHPKVPRGEHYIIEYSEPLAGNEIAFGLDLAGLAPHKAALELGRDTGKVVSTERITLVQDQAGQPGFVARSPIYRQGMPLDTVEQRRTALTGWVAIVFKVNTLMREVIDDSLMTQLAVQIHDAGNVSDGASMPPGPGNIMFARSDAGSNKIAALSTEKRLRVAQRQWVARFDALPGPRYSANPSMVVWVAACGVLISALFAALLIANERNRRLAAQVNGTPGK